MKVEKQHIENSLIKLEFKFARVENTTVTGCWAFLPNGFQVAYGESACVDPANYKWEDGCKYAKERCLQEARNKLWELEGYLLKVTGQTSDQFERASEAFAELKELKSAKPHAVLKGFKVYQGKAIERIAYEVKPDDAIIPLKQAESGGPCLSEIAIGGERYEFAHFEPVNAGDFVCFLDAKDIYHVRRSVFEQRNYI
ncbi:TPA: hypothetical protein I6Z04_000109 [Vibrio cholerae]|nr:hypothetical protein [Vibrio cholerae]